MCFTRAWANSVKYTSNFLLIITNNDQHRRREQISLYGDVTTSPCTEFTRLNMGTSTMTAKLSRWPLPKTRTAKSYFTCLGKVALSNNCIASWKHWLILTHKENHPVAVVFVILLKINKGSGTNFRKLNDKAGVPLNKNVGSLLWVQE